jgi:hypothetical protein
MANTYGLKILETLLTWPNLTPDQFEAILSSPNTSGAKYLQANKVFDTIDRKRQKRFYYHFRQSDQPLIIFLIMDFDKGILDEVKVHVFLFYIIYDRGLKLA